MASSGLPAANKARKTKQAKEAEGVFSSCPRQAKQEKKQAKEAKGVPPFLPVTERKGVH